MGLNTYPYSPFPASTEQLHRGDNEQIQAEIDQLKSDLTDLSEEVNGDAITYPYADVITIEDAVPANIAECNVKIEPVQDLHGYDKPWVGGAGKNKCNPTGNSTTYGDYSVTKNTDGSYTVTGGGTGEQVIAILAGEFTAKANTEYHLNGCPTGGGSGTYRLDVRSDGATIYKNVSDDGSGATFTADEDATLYVYIRFGRGYAITGSVTFYPMICLASETDKSFAPYTNICPISGHTEASVVVTDGDETTKTYTIALGSTIYGGTVDFDSGVMTVTMAQIASYDGETIGEPWISDRDVYDEGTTPTTGAQVVYTLAEPTTIQLTPQQIQLLKGTNTLTASTGDISVTVNGVSGAIGAVQEQVNATDAALAELTAEIAEQLPTAPTTDGAYILTVTVESGTPTYSWESAE